MIYTVILVRAKQDLSSSGFQTSGPFTRLHCLIMTEGLEIASVLVYKSNKEESKQVQQDQRKIKKITEREYLNLTKT